MGAHTNEGMRTSSTTGTYPRTAGKTWTGECSLSEITNTQSKWFFRSIFLFWYRVKCNHKHPLMQRASANRPPTLGKNNKFKKKKKQTRFRVSTSFNPASTASRRETDHFCPAAGPGVARVGKQLGGKLGLLRIGCRVRAPILCRGQRSRQPSAHDF